MSGDKLRSYSKKKLAQLARQHGIAGWHAMRKQQLIRALSATKNGGTKSGRSLRRLPRKRPLNRRHHLSLRASRSKRNGAALQPRPNGGHHKLATNGASRDRIMLVARDPFWLHVAWEISSLGVQRAEAALREEWHGAKPILRVLDVTSEDTTANSEAHVRDIDIQGGTNNWYIDVADAPRSFRVDIGYLSRHRRFYALAHSNVVTTPRAGVSDAIDENWQLLQDRLEKTAEDGNGDAAADADPHVVDLFDERLRVPLGAAPIVGAGLFGRSRNRRFWFDLDAELIVYGCTEPSARVTLQGDRVQLRPDGSFTMRFSLPDKRLIIPATATRADGSEERTVVLAIERNTKELEPMVHDGNE